MLQSVVLFLRAVLILRASSTTMFTISKCGPRLHSHFYGTFYCAPRKSNAFSKQAPNTRYKSPTDRNFFPTIKITFIWLPSAFKKRHFYTSERFSKLRRRLKRCYRWKTKSRKKNEVENKTKAVRLWNRSTKFVLHLYLLGFICLRVTQYSAPCSWHLLPVSWKTVKTKLDFR